MHLRIIYIFLVIIIFSVQEIEASEGTGHVQISPEPYFTDAIIQYREGNLSHALEKFRFLADNRYYLNNSEIAGISLFMTGQIMEELKLDGALSYLEQAISVYPLIADYALFRSAESLERLGNLADAAELYKKVCDSFPESGIHKKALIRASKNDLAAGRTKEARAGFNAFLNHYPNDVAVPDVLYNIGISLINDGHKSSAEEYFKRIWIYHPASREAHLVKARIHTPLRPDETYRRGTNLYGKGYYEEALDEFKRLLSQNKTVPHTIRKDALFKTGMTYARLRMSAEAEEKLERFLRKYPGDGNAPEAAYWLGRSYLRQNKEDAFISSSKLFLRQYKKDDRYPEVLYRLGNIYAERNDIASAFLYLDRVIMEYPFSSYSSDSLWRKGWISYRTGDIDGAIEIFNKIINAPEEHAYRSQAIYWRAKASVKKGNYKSMEQNICSLCNDHETSFYCLFSEYYYREWIKVFSCESVAMDVHPTNYFENPEESPGLITGSDVQLTRIRLFIYLGLKDEAVSEILKLRSRFSDNREESIIIASILSSLGEYNRAMYTVRPYIPSLWTGKGSETDKRLWSIVYPSGYYTQITHHAEKNNLDPFLVHAIIREESWFNKEAVSPAGALGLMQLMPATAKRVAKESYSGRESLFDPEINISLGTRYLAERLRQFDYNIFMAIASYNAGPEAVERWMNAFDGVELDEFIENIPYKETREYVKKVFRSYMLYKRLYNKDSRIDTL